MPAPPGPAQVMQAQPQVQGNQAAQLVVQVAPLPAFTLGAGRDNQVLDFTDVGAKKQYYKAIASLEEKIDESHDNCVAFLSGVTEWVRQFGLAQIMSINVGLASWVLLVNYGQIAMDDITMSVNNDTSTQTHDAKNSEMLYQFLLSSLATEFKTKILLHQGEFMINNEPVRGCLFQENCRAHICGHHGYSTAHS